MLSPQLLVLLRLWWREGKRRSVMLPHGWLFPGRNCLEPLSTRQLNRAVHEAAEAAGIKKRVSLRRGGGRRKSRRPPFAWLACVPGTMRLARR
jgi:integrase